MDTEYDSARDRASAALAEFRRRLPLLTGFARSFSGNKRVRVVASGSGSFTNGDTVHLEVPLPLADKVRHNEKYCDEWDSQGFQMCPACAVRDDLNYQLFHEIAHIWGGSFDDVTKHNLNLAVRMVQEYLPGVRNIDDIQEMEGKSWLAVAYEVHPFIKELHNGFEDARVNGLMAKVRPGVRQWRRAFESRLTVEGVRRFDPRTNTETRFHPGEAPLNAQMVYALYGMAADNKIPTFVDEYVAKQLSDPRVEQLTSEAFGHERAEKTFEFAVRAYALMAEMGFFGNEDKLHQEPEQDDQGAPDAGEKEDESGEPDDCAGGEGGSPQEDEASSGDTEDADSTSEGDTPGSDDDSRDDHAEAGTDSDLDSREGGEGGGPDEPSDGSAEQSEADGEASDGVAEESADSEDPGEAESAHEGEDDPGAGGESQADEVDPDAGDESSDGSNPGDSGEGAAEESSGNASEGDASLEGDESAASAGEGSLEEGDNPRAEEVDDDGGSGEVSDATGDADSEGDSSVESSGDGDGGEDADQETSAEGDGPGEGGDQGETDEVQSGDSDSDDDSSADSGADHGGSSDDPGVGEDGSVESSTQDEADAAEGGTQGSDEGGPAEADGADGEDDGESSESQDNLGTGQPGESAEGEPGSGQDGEVGGTGDGEADSNDPEDADRDEVGSGEPVDRPDSGVDEDFAGDSSGESDGNAGAHGDSGSSSGATGKGTSNLLEGSGDDDTAEPEEADVAPVEPQDDTPPEDRDWGDVQEVHERLEELFGHHSPNEAELEEVREQLERLVRLGDVFDEVPRNVTQVWWNRWGKHYHSEEWGDAATAWTHKVNFGYWFYDWSRDEIGIDGDFRVSDAVIGKALLKARVAFSDNARKKDIRNLKYGRVNARVLGRRAPVHDARLFKKVARPGKRDYFVVIGLDLSASTASIQNGPDKPLNALALIKRSAMAQAEILSRLGVKFAIYGHSCKLASNSLELDDWAVNMYVIKEAHESWSEPTRRRLEALGPDEGNLDGHTLQLYRKIAEKENATDKIIMYYTDGAIPAANGEEEGGILVKQIERCKKEGIALMGVGVGTDSLSKFGFDYTRVDRDEDIVKVVNNLERRLAE